MDPGPTGEQGRDHDVAVFAFRGDIRQLSCDAWYLPADFGLVVRPSWLDGDPDLRRAVSAARGERPADWGETGSRVLPLRLRDSRRATPVLAAIPTQGTDEWAYHEQTLRQYVDAAVGAKRPEHMADLRSRRLLAVPLIGTGWSTGRPSNAEHVLGLLRALEAEGERASVDFALVVFDERHWPAVQAVRRRRLQERGVDPAIESVAEHAERLAALALQGRLVLLTGAGISRPAGLPDWKRLLSDLAQWAGFDAPTARHLAKMDLLDQAALIGSRKNDGELADEVAARMDAPHHSLAHGLLANLPVQENVTLNYDALFERAAQAAGRPVGVLPYEPAEDRWLLKLHGDVAPERRRDIVLTRGDYLNVSEHRAALTGLVQALLVTRHMLFVGFGLTDPHLHAVIHDVRRALGPARPGKLGTALLLERDALQEELWKKDLDYLAMGPSGDAGEAARRLEMFLDHLLLLATTSDGHLFDASYDALLSPAERDLRDALAVGLADVDLVGTSAGRRVLDLLRELGWRR
jgi:hypothetical protein